MMMARGERKEERNSSAWPACLPLWRESLHCESYHLETYKSGGVTSPDLPCEFYLQVIECRVAGRVGYLRSDWMNNPIFHKLVRQ
jgi:hypothetical protein